MGELSLVGAWCWPGCSPPRGMGKLADPSGARAALRDFGLPDVLGRPLARTLPGAELFIALALVPGPTSRFGALAAFALLAGFTLAVAVNLARGRTPDCHCFGQVHSKPIGPGTLARNTVLGATSGLVLFGPDGTVGGWWADLGTAGRMGAVGAVLLVVVVAFQGGLLVNLLRQQGRLVLRLDALEALVGTVDAGDRPGLPVGSPTPTFALPDPWGARVTLDELLARGRPVLLIFADPGCGPCNELFPDLGRWQRD